jgi:glyoxylase-like metal-dependent hydrolase (beta-lactamase superfamily II)
MQDAREEEAVPVSWNVGSARITSVTELELPIPGAGIVPEATPERLARHAWLAPFVTPNGRLRLLIQALVVESDGRRIVVDTCVGNDKDRTLPPMHRLNTSFLDDLKAAGFPRESIDTVVCTHLHVDHVGWNTMKVDGRWVPTFPNARYLVVRREWEHWSREDDRAMGDVLGDSVAPVFDAGLVDLVEPGHAVTPEVALEPTHGHTPGHVSVRIRSAGAEVVITGDLMHHPVQCAHPEWGSSADIDPEAAAATRRAFLAAQADRPVGVIGTHFAGPHLGRIVRDGTAYRFEVG